MNSVPPVAGKKPYLSPATRAVELKTESDFLTVRAVLAF